MNTSNRDYVDDADVGDKCDWRVTVLLEGTPMQVRKDGRREESLYEYNVSNL